MAVKRFVAYYTNDDELSKVSKVSTSLDKTDSFVLGEIEEENIGALTSQGILIELLEYPKRAPAREPGGDLASVKLHSGVRSLPGKPMEQTLNPTGASAFVVELKTPHILESWRAQLLAIGVVLEESLQDDRYLAHLRLSQVTRLRDLSFVRNVYLMGSYEHPSAIFRSTRAVDRTAIAEGEEVPAAILLPAAGEVRARLRFDVLLYDSKGIDDFTTWINQNNIALVAAGKHKVRIEVDEDSAQLRRIEALPYVRQVLEYVAPALSNESCRRLMGLMSASSASAKWAYSGAGEAIGIADSGIDIGHPDFRGRILGTAARGRPGDPSDPQGHGTHVAGTALGSGESSMGQHQGVAPDCKLFFQSILDARGRLGGLPLELGELFNEAYEAGARIHNNSWSSDTKSFYTFEAMEVDEFVYAHPDFLVVIAAGNGATAVDPIDGLPGSVYLQSTGSPATAKNALTVGASRSDRHDGAYSNRTFGDLDPIRFGAAPIGNQNVSGDAQCLAAFSGRGPSDPRRIKPDIVAPGTDILSTRASTAPAGSFWGTYPANDRYAYLGGTSMSAPAVSGCAAVVREYYREARNHSASAALVKATLINGTKRLTGEDANVGHSDLPNFNQGFGAVHMPFTHPNEYEDWMQLDFIDTYQRSGGFLETGETHKYAFEVGKGKFLRLCLAWMDPSAGSSLQNNLGMILAMPSNPPRKLMGNQHRPQPIGLLDRDNNVQIVRVEAPSAGSYVLQIFASNLLKPKQDYALVVTGELMEGLVRI